MPTMQDINFSFAEQQKAREERRRFLSDIDPRRRSVATSAPDVAGRSPWKVRQLGDADREPRWTVATDKSGKRTFSEHRPAENCGLFDAKNRPQNASRFSLKIVRGVCLCREFDAESGDFVSCLGATAVELINTGKAEVLEEVRPPL